MQARKRKTSFEYRGYKRLQPHGWPEGYRVALGDPYTMWRHSGAPDNVIAMLTFGLPRIFYPVRSSFTLCCRTIKYM